MLAKSSEKKATSWISLKAMTWNEVQELLLSLAGGGPLGRVPSACRCISFTAGGEGLGKPLLKGNEGGAAEVKGAAKVDAARNGRKLKKANIFDKKIYRYEGSLLSDERNQRRFDSTVRNICFTEGNRD